MAYAANLSRHRYRVHPDRAQDHFSHVLKDNTQGSLCVTQRSHVRRCDVGSLSKFDDLVPRIRDLPAENLKFRKGIALLVGQISSPSPRFAHIARSWHFNPMTRGAIRVTYRNRAIFTVAGQDRFGRIALFLFSL